MMSCVVAPFSIDERYSISPNLAGAILSISFQSGNEGNIFLPTIVLDTALLVYDARDQQTVSYATALKMY